MKVANFIHSRPRRSCNLSVLAIKYTSERDSTISAKPGGRETRKSSRRSWPMRVLYSGHIEKNHPGRPWVQLQQIRHFGISRWAIQNQDMQVRVQSADATGWVPQAAGVGCALRRFSWVALRIPGSMQVQNLTLAWRIPATAGQGIS